MGGWVIVDPRPLLCEIFLMHHEKISENVLDSQDSCSGCSLLLNRIWHPLLYLLQ